jgi:1-acyl-sn-glycerol-3-phosphate acyltransferase
MFRIPATVRAFIDEVTGSSKGHVLPYYAPDRLDNRNPDLIEIASKLLERYVIPYHRAEIEGTSNIPDGKAMYVGNHNGGVLSVDSFIAGFGMYQEGGLSALPFGLAHDLIIENRLLNPLLVPLGAVRACRENAQRLFEEGHKVLVYPGGDIETFRPFSERNMVKFGGRKGYIRMALRHDVPIIPMVAAGAHSTMIVLNDLRGLPEKLGLEKFLRMEVWPIILSIPWGITFGPSPPYIPLPTKIRIRFLEPIQFDRSGEEALKDAEYVADCAHRVEYALQEALTEMTDQRLALKE